MKINELIDLYEGISAIIKDESLKLPAHITYALVRNMKELLIPLDSLIQTKDDIMERYGEMIDGELRVPPQNISAANEELRELNETDVPIELMKIDLDQIRDIPLTGKQMEGLYLMIKD